MPIKIAMETLKKQVWRLLGLGLEGVETSVAAFGRSGLEFIGEKSP